MKWWKNSESNSTQKTTFPNPWVPEANERRDGGCSLCDNSGLARSQLVPTEAAHGRNGRTAGQGGSTWRERTSEKLKAPPAPLQIVKLQLIAPRESRPSRHRPPAKVTFVDATKTFAARNASGCHSTVVNYFSRSFHKGTLFLQNTKPKSQPCR